MSNTNETDRMNERRRNMGLPPITQRASKPTRQMTTEDIREYLEEVKAIAEKLFPNQSDRDKYVSDIRSNVKKELLAEKVQLTDDDQILILDRITGKVKTTKVNNIKSKETNEPAKKSKDFFNNKSKDLNEDTSSSIIKIIELAKNNDKLTKKEKSAEALRAVRNNESLEQLTFALETLSKGQQVTIKLLEQLRDKISSARGNSGSSFGNGFDASSFLKRNAGTIVTGAILGGVAISNAIGSSGSDTDTVNATPGSNIEVTPPMAASPDGADVDALGLRPESTQQPAITEQQIPEGATPVRLDGRVVGYMPAGGGPTVTFTDNDRQALENVRTQVIGSQLTTPPAATPTGATTSPSAPQLVSQSAAVPTTARPEGPRVFRRSGTAGELSFTYERTADGKHYIDGREVDAQTYNRVKQVMFTDTRTDPRYQQYLQEAVARDVFAPRIAAENRITEENSAELTSSIERIRTQPVAERSATQPAAQVASPPATPTTASANPAEGPRISFGTQPRITGRPQSTSSTSEAAAAMAATPDGADVDALGLRPEVIATVAPQTSAIAARVNRQGNFTFAGANIPYAAQNGVYTIGQHEVDEATFNEFLELRNTRPLYEAGDFEGINRRNADTAKFLDDVRSGRRTLRAQSNDANRISSPIAATPNATIIPQSTTITTPITSTPVTTVAPPVASAAPVNAERVRQEAFNTAAQQYQNSIQEKERVALERAAFEERYGQADTERTIAPEPGSGVSFRPYQVRAYSDPEAQRQYLDLNQRESTAKRQEREAVSSATSNITGMRPGSRPGLGGGASDVTPEMIRALVTRYGYTTEQLQRYGGGPTNNNFVEINGIRYSFMVRHLFNQELKKELAQRTAAPETSTTDATAAPTATLTPVIDAAPAVTPSPVAPSTPSALSPRISSGGQARITRPPTAPALGENAMVASPYGADVGSMGLEPQSSVVSTTPVSPRAGSYVHTEAEKNHLKRIVTGSLGPNKREHVDEVVEQLLTLPFPFFRGQPLPRSDFALQGLVRDYINSRPELRDRTMEQAIQVLNVGGRETFQMVQDQQQPATVEPVAPPANTSTTVPVSIADAERVWPTGHVEDLSALVRSRLNMARQPERFEEVMEAMIRLNPRGLSRSGFLNESLLRDYLTANTGRRTESNELLGQAVQQMDVGGRETFQMVQDQQERVSTVEPNAEVIITQPPVSLEVPSATPVTTASRRHAHTEGELKHLRDTVRGSLGASGRQHVDAVFNHMLQVYQDKPLPRSDFMLTSQIRDYIISRPEFRNPVLSQAVQQMDVGGRETFQMVQDQQQPTGAADPNTEVVPQPPAIPTRPLTRSIATPTLATAPTPDAEPQTTSSFRTLDASNISRRDNFEQSVDATTESPAGGFEFANENVAQPSVTAVARSQPMTKQINTNVDEELVVNNAVNEREALSKEYESNPVLFSNRNLVLRAKKVTFASDDIEFKLPTQSATAQRVPSGGGESPIASLMTPPPSVSVSDSIGGASSSAGASTEGTGSQQLATEQGSATSTTADTSGLSFAPGVDPRINRDIAQKVKQIESAFGKSLTITSGFRDEQRNTRAGGARNSAHTRANAIDIQFRGNQEETNKLIEVASAAGIGGIGVYRPGWLHLDTESKRVWGPDFSARSIPEWAKDTLQAHMSGQIRRTPAAESSASGSDATPITASESSTPSTGSGESGSDSSGGGDATPVSGGESSTPGPVSSSDTGGVMPVSQPVDTATSGSIVNSASVDNVMAERAPAPQTSSVIDMSAESTNPSLRAPQYNNDPNDPGNVEPDDAAERYARLFDMAA